VWTNFYGKLRKLRDESMKLNVFNEIKGGGATVDSIFANTYDNMNRYADKIFTHEEGRGRYVDMHTYYNIFINLKKVHRISIDLETIIRLKRRIFSKLMIIYHIFRILTSITS
jgi:hypothetical protein